MELDSHSDYFSLKKTSRRYFTALHSMVLKPQCLMAGRVTTA